MDATALKVCHNRRISNHKVFDKLAARGKTSVDWFFGFTALCARITDKKKEEK
jgi:hypothetical protein